jgi:hypothetical protein
MIKCQQLSIGFVHSVYFYSIPLKYSFSFIQDHIFHINGLQIVVESDSIEQLQTKLKRYTTEIESLRHRGIGKCTKHEIEPFYFWSLNFYRYG